jgi:four helix bundle suffix protein
LDYEDYLRQRGLEQRVPEHPALMRFKAKRCGTVAEVRTWVEQERRIKHGQARPNKDDHGTGKSEPVRESPCSSVCSPELVSNARLSLLNLCCYLLDRQLSALAAALEKEGGFAERLYRVRGERRRNGPARPFGRR